MGRIFEKQLTHLVCLLLVLLGVLAASRLPGFSEGELLGLRTDAWATLCVANAITHQVFVWLCWRLELHSHALSRRLGANAFASYAVAFAVLIIARPLLVTAGIFRFIPNAMYVCGFFALWIPALLGRSVAAIVIAAFSHLYIWVHYFCTEKPDMRIIYGSE